MKTALKPSPAVVGSESNYKIYLSHNSFLNGFPSCVSCRSFLALHQLFFNSASLCVCVCVVMN